MRKKHEGVAMETQREHGDGDTPKPRDVKPEGMSKNQWKKQLKKQRLAQGRAEWKYVHRSNIAYRHVI